MTGVTKVPPNGVEVVERRQLRAKVFDLGDGKRQYRTGIAVVHTPSDYGAFTHGDPHTWDEVNLEIGPDFNAWYTVKRVGGKIRVDFKRGGHIDVDLDGTPFPAPVVNGNKLEWDDIEPDLDIWMEANGAQVEFYKRIKAPGARSLKWNFRENAGRFKVQTNTSGMDAKRRQLHITHVVTPRKPVGQDETWGFTETITGKTLVRNRTTRQKEISADITYPIVVDALITEDIVAEGDDGFMFDADGGYGSWNTDVVAFGNDYYYGGLRFQSIALANTVTIDSSYLKGYVGYETGGGWAPTVAIDNVDDAAVFGDDDGPPDWSFTPYAGGHSWDLGAAYNSVASLTVTTSVAQVIGRAGWSSGNDIRFGQTNDVASGTSSYIDDYPAAGAAYLEINYTVGGAANPKGPFGHPFHGPFGGPVG